MSMYAVYYLMAGLCYALILLSKMFIHVHKILLKYYCSHTHTHTFTQSCGHTHTHSRMHTHTHIHTCIHVHTLTYTHPHTPCTHNYTHTHTHTHIHVYRAATWHLDKSRSARHEYLKERIDGAVFFDIDEICDKSSSFSHMLPSPEQFSEQVGQVVQA